MGVGGGGGMGDICGTWGHCDLTTSKTVSGLLFFFFVFF